MVPIDQKRCRTLIRASEEVRLSFAVGKSVGSRYMQSYVVVHPATTKFLANFVVFKRQIEKEGLPRDSPAGLGAGGPRFKSGRPDQKYLACFLLVIEGAVHLKPRLWNSGRQEFSIRKSFTF